MAVASRTPEGDANRCPVCNNELTLEPSQPPGDAPCPSCGCLVWFEREEKFGVQGRWPIMEQMMREADQSLREEMERLRGQIDDLLDHIRRREITVTDEKSKAKK